jgi:chromosome segregation ATPase
MNMQDELDGLKDRVTKLELRHETAVLAGQIAANAHFAEMDQKINVLTGEVGYLRTKVDTFDARFEGIDRRLDGFDGRLARLEDIVKATSQGVIHLLETTQSLAETVHTLSRTMEERLPPLVN